MQEEQVKFARQAASVIHKINSSVIIVSFISLLAMILLVVVDVIGRYFFNKPIAGGMETQELMMVLVVFLAMGVATRDKQHVVVEVLVQHLKKRALAVVNAIVCLLGFGFATLMTWQTLKGGLADLRSPTGDFTPILEIPIAPFIIVAAVGLALMSLEFFIQMMVNINQFSANKSPVTSKPAINTDSGNKPGVIQHG
jgi:TRAP-type transport system small permease protein